MTSGFEILGHSRALQTHWLRRIGAYALDAILIFLPTWLVFFVLGMPDPALVGIASGIAFAFYGSVAEALTGRTLGKHGFGLEVRSLRGPLTLGKAAIRNAPKFFWYIFPLLDLLLALVMSGDPRQRFSDRIGGTTVVWRDARPAHHGTGEASGPAAND